MKNDRSYLLHIRDATRRISMYTTSGRDAFLSDPKTQDAVIRNLEIVGEAAKNLSQELRSRRGDIPWRQVTGMRDRLIHGYFGIDLDLVWETVEKDIPKIERAVEEVLADNSSE